jgi:hypothetical protein
MWTSSLRVNGRFVIAASADPSNLAAECTRAWRLRCPAAVDIESDYLSIDHLLSIYPEPGKRKGVELRTEAELAAGSHVGWVEGLLTNTHPDSTGVGSAFQLCEEPPVYIDTSEAGSLVTFINEEFLAPNCTATFVLHRGQLRIQVTTNCTVPAGCALSMCYRSVKPENFRRELELHSWGRSLTPSGQLSTGLRHCANRRYHSAEAPGLTSMLCVECTARLSRAVAFCSDSCFASHVADHASDDPEDLQMSTPARANHAKPVITRLMTPRACSRM